MCFKQKRCFGWDMGGYLDTPSPPPNQSSEPKLARHICGHGIASRHRSLFSIVKRPLQTNVHYYHLDQDHPDRRSAFSMPSEVVKCPSGCGRDISSTQAQYDCPTCSSYVTA